MSVLPFVLPFYSQPSQYLWSDDCEQGDTLTPMLYALGQHGALESIQESLLPDEHLFAHLDDLFVVCSPERVGPIYKLLKTLWRHKTQVWNRHYPPGCCACNGLLNALIRTHVFGEAMDCPRSKESVFSVFPSVTLIS